MLLKGPRHDPISVRKALAVLREVPVAPLLVSQDSACDDGASNARKRVQTLRSERLQQIRVVRADDDAEAQTQRVEVFGHILEDVHKGGVDQTSCVNLKGGGEGRCGWCGWVGPGAQRVDLVAEQVQVVLLTKGHESTEDGWAVAASKWIMGGCRV